MIDHNIVRDRIKKHLVTIRQLYRRHLYLFMVVVSSVIMSIAGLFCLTVSGEKYGDQPALVATAINTIEQRFTGEDEDGMIDLASIKTAGGKDTTGDKEVTEDAEDTDDPGDSDEEVLDEDDEEDAEDADEPDDSEETGTEESDGYAQNEEETGTAGHEGATAQGDVGSVSSDIPDKYAYLWEETDSEKASSDNGDGESGKKKKKDSSSKKKKSVKWESVDESYFDDALFIGDSRQQGFGMYSGLDNATLYAVKSYTVFVTSTKPLVDTPFGKITLTDALAINQHRFKKVYIMLGINEIGTGKDIEPYYYNLIDYIKLTQPGAVIYLESVIHVTAHTAAARPSLSNEKIDERNELLRKIAKEEGIIFLDINEVLTDENGALFADAASDGIHLKSQYIGVMKDYLMSHAVQPKLKKKKRKDDEEMVDEYGFSYVELTPAQQMFKDQLDAYYSAQALQLTEQLRAQEQLQQQQQ